MDKKVCAKCGAENAATRYFCGMCGSFLNMDNYEESHYLAHQLKLVRIADNLRHMSLKESIPDELYEHYAEKMERYEAIYNLPEFPRNKQLIGKMKDFLELCRHPEFQIAFVGTIKTGKSTLINALLGDNYASMAVTPETAALTKFRYSPKDYVQVEFYSAAEWKKLWASRNNAEKFMEEYNELHADDHKDLWVGHPLEHKELAREEVKDELTKWSSSQSPEHYFVKEIEVGISTLPHDFPPQVVFVDTPGLFDPVAYRSKITQDYIRKAHAVFVCVDAQKVSQPEIEIIASVFALSSNNKEKVHIVATHWDKLNNPEEDWKEQKDYLVRQLTGKGFFPDNQTASENIIPTAAYIHNLCRDYDIIDNKDRKSLKKFAIDFDYDADKPSDRECMTEKANIHTVYRIIKEKLADNYRRFLSDDIKNKYLTIHHDLARIAEDMHKEATDLLQASESSLDEFKQKAEQKRQDVEEIAKVTGQLNKIMDDVETATARQMEEICGQLRLKVNPAYVRANAKQSKSNLRSAKEKVKKAGKSFWPFGRR